MKSLYTNITNHEGTDAVKEKLNAQSGKPIAKKCYNKISLSNNNS